MSGREKVVVIGLDGATWDIIRPMVEEGRLPNLSHLLREGSHGVLRSVLHPYTAQAWTTMITGIGPGRHRIFDFWERDFSTYGFRLLNASARARPSLWRILSQRGRRVIVLNVPMTYPPEEVNGILVSGRDTPGMDAEYTYPREIKPEIIAASGGRYIIVPDDWLHSQRGRPDLAREELFREIRVRFRVAEHLMEKYPWDLLWLVVSATDGAAHFFWKYFDPQHPLYNPQAAIRYGETIREAYSRVDAEIGRTLEKMPPQTTVLIVSDHGQGGISDRAIHLNLWLAQEGLLAFRQSNRGSPQALAARGLGGLKKALYSRLSFQALTKLRRLFPDRLRRSLGPETFFPGIDWQRTRAFSEEVRGNIWINLRGRDPQGIVDPGEEYEVLRTLIIERLPKISDPITGERLIHHVYRREELHPGPYVERLPDLIIEGRQPDLFKPRGDTQRGEAVRILSREEMAGLKTSGGHRMEGILLAWGPGVAHRKKISEGQLVDLAPTVMHLLGEPVPQEMEGRVLSEIFTPEFRDQQPVKYTPEGVEGAPSAPEGEYSEEESQAVKERLEGLGYFG